MRITRKRSAAMPLAGLLACACVSQPPEGKLIADPFERQNRAIYAFNDRFDRAVVDPVAGAYESLLPQWSRRRLRDFVDNLRTPLWFVNDVLQGDARDASRQAGRFIINSSVGVLGFYDFAAERLDLEKEPEDFGQTLAVWGVPEGPFLMAPFVGPFTPRDGFGWLADRSLDPFTWTRWEGDVEILTGSIAVRTIDARVRGEDVIERLRASPDPYVALRSTYIQNRRGDIEENTTHYDDLPEFD